MSFLCTVDGELQADVPHREYAPGVWGWPQPWALSCNGCGRVFEYGCVALNDRQLAPPTVRQIAPDQHRCAYCEGYVEQLELFGVAA